MKVSFALQLVAVSPTVCSAEKVDSFGAPLRCNWWL
jgi:hypothetical protein